MLTLLDRKNNFLPLMQTRFIYVITVLFALLLQSCYTLLRPPATQPQSVTTVTSSPAMASSLGGSGYYGWDPYWEPALPYTSYHQGYGASYYSPYNYYDYQDPYYAPVYIVGEATDPSPGRDYSRDDRQGGSRDRELKDPGLVAAEGYSAGSVRSANSTAPSVSVKETPVVPTPIPIKPPVTRDIKAGKPSRETQPIKQKNVRPPKKKKNTSNPKQDKPLKRMRTRD